MPLAQQERKLVLNVELAKERLERYRIGSSEKQAGHLLYKKLKQYFGNLMRANFGGGLLKGTALSMVFIIAREI